MALNGKTRQNNSKPQPKRGDRFFLQPIGWILLLGLVLWPGCRASVHSNATGDNPHDIKPIVKPPAVVDANPNWFGCQADKDCTVEEGICGEQQAVNKQYTTQFFSYQDEMSRSVGCINEAVDDKLYKAKCVKRRCNLNPPPDTRPPKR